MKVRHFVAQGFVLAVTIALVLSLIGYLGEFNFYLELTSHFKLQYLVVGLCSLVFFSFRRKKRWLAVSAVCVLLNLMAIFPWYLPYANTSSQSKAFRVLLANVNVKNQNYAATIDLIRQEDPDLVVIIETNRSWLSQLESVQNLLPYSLKSSQADSFGLAMYSKVPLEVNPGQRLSQSDPEIESAQILAQLKINGTQISTIALHPPPPIRQALAERRNRHLAAIGQLAKQQNQPTIVIGDLNTSLWSPIYQKFQRTSGLLNSRQGFGILPTWTARFPLLMIPIDHCLTSSDIQTINIRTGKNIGSDHLPLIVDLAL